MAVAKLYQAGNTIDYTPGSAKSQGNVEVVGTLVGVVVNDTPANTLGALAITGTYEIPKDTSTAFAAGAAVYWDVADDECNSDSSNPFIGKAAYAAAEADTDVYVVLLTAQAAVDEALGLANLSDVGTATPTLGNLLIADGTDFDSAKLDPLSLKVETTGAAVPMHLFVLATATGATEIPTPAVKMRIVNAWAYQRGTTETNINILNASSTATRANVAAGTTADAFKQLEVTDAQYTVLSTSTLEGYLSTANAGGVEFHVLAVPVT